MKGELERASNRAPSKMILHSDNDKSYDVRQAWPEARFPLLRFT